MFIGVALSGVTCSFIGDYPPYHTQKKIKKETLSLNGGASKPCKASRFAIGQHLRTFGQMEVKRLICSGCFGLVSTLINRYLRGCLEGKREGIIPTLKQTNPPKQQHPHQPEQIPTNHTHEEEHQKDRP
jgi:hypothetical protein